LSHLSEYIIGEYFYNIDTGEGWDVAYKNSSTKSREQVKIQRNITAVVSSFAAGA
jgi:hypothetical protein